MTPNKERIKLWVDALRSGEFGQTRGMLTDSAGSYCCLGVACEVARREGGIDILPWEYEIKDWKYSNGCWPPYVHEWFGLPAGPRLGEDMNGVFLDPIHANDALQWDFNQIADAIEAEYINNREDSN